MGPVDKLYEKYIFGGELKKEDYDELVKAGYLRQKGEDYVITEVGRQVLGDITERKRHVAAKDPTGLIAKALEKEDPKIREFVSFLDSLEKRIVDDERKKGEEDSHNH